MKKGKVTYLGLRPASEAASTLGSSIVFGKNLVRNSKTSFLYSKRPTEDKDIDKTKLLLSKDTNGPNNELD